MKTLWEFIKINIIPIIIVLAVIVAVIIFAVKFKGCGNDTINTNRDSLQELKIDSLTLSNSRIEIKLDSLFVMIANINIEQKINYIIYTKDKEILNNMSNDSLYNWLINQYKK